ncbi:MAG: GNAT family N-acetyltransferase [bacterium]
MLKIIQAKSGEHLKQIRELFAEYTDWLGFDLSFQNYEKEFAELPGNYVPPKGRLLLAIYQSKLAGCVGLREYAKGICEMKRLYVRPRFRKKGIGRKLAIAVIDQARKIGYKSMRLDTVPWMKEAIELYFSLGFKKIKPYRYNPIKGSLFMELILR